MAEVVEMRNNALPYPVWGFPRVVKFPIFDADGDLVTGATGLDSEISINGDAFADCISEATEIGSSGMYYLVLAPLEQQATNVTIIVKTSTVGAKTTPIVLEPVVLPQAITGQSPGGGGDEFEIVLDSNASQIDGYYAGMVIKISVDGTVCTRMIEYYDGADRLCYLAEELPAVVDKTDTYAIYMPLGMVDPKVIADAHFCRNWEDIVDAAIADRSSLNAMRAIRNKTSVAAGTLTITKENDSTTAWTAAVTSDASAEPIIGVDPA